MATQTKRIFFYSGFINKLIRAGRGNHIKPFFIFGKEISPKKFTKYANKFIEDYYATVPPEFAITHPIKFGMGSISKEGMIWINSDIRAHNIDRSPMPDAGLLYIETRQSNDDDKALDASVFRQACFIKRERFKFFMAVTVSVIAITSFIFSITFKK
jgi:hypothetical protein